jgi:hypothetical protein
MLAIETHMIMPGPVELQENSFCEHFEILIRWELHFALTILEMLGTYQMSWRLRKTRGDEVIHYPIVRSTE